MEIEKSSLAPFCCTLCGECCRGNQKVWLNPVDLLRLAAHLGYGDTGHLIDERIILIEAGEHGAPRARLRFPPGPVGPACRFLVNDLDEEGRLWGRCSLHDTAAKPLVCRLAPLSRLVDLAVQPGAASSKQREFPSAAHFEEWREVPPVIGCPGWGDEPPPPKGREISVPVLPEALRVDLNAETEFFRRLEDMMERGEPHELIAEVLYVSSDLIG